MTNQLTIMESLKETTRPLHTTAENHHFQFALASGDLPLGVYANYLGQLYLVHNALEQGLKTNSKTHPAIAASVTEDQYNTPFLLKDLSLLEVNKDKLIPSPATRELVAEITAAGKDNPLALLGFHYVLLGSKHGGKFIAKTWEKKLNLGPAVGCSYFDPYGSTFMEKWKHFVNGMNNASLTNSEREGILNAANIMFKSIGNIGEEMLNSQAS